MYQDYGLLIGGEWRKRGGAGEIEVADPATGEVIGASPAASVTDVEDAIAAAEQGLKIWRATPAWTRADVLHKAADIMLTRSEDAARRNAQKWPSSGLSDRIRKSPFSRCGTQWEKVPDRADEGRSRERDRGRI